MVVKEIVEMISVKKIAKKKKKDSMIKLKKMVVLRRLMKCGTKMK